MKPVKMTQKARKLLGDNSPDGLWNDMGLRSNEHDSITHERLLEFVKTYPVIDVSIGNNNYGEFQFVSLHVICFANDGSPYDELLQFWGNGYHEYRDTLQINWRINVGNYGIYSNRRVMNKKDVLRLIKSRRDELGITDKTRQESSGNLFETIADLTDDDGAYTALQDMEF